MMQFCKVLREITENDCIYLKAKIDCQTLALSKNGALSAQ